jgi:hypothetical protein
MEHMFDEGLPLVPENPEHARRLQRLIKLSFFGKPSITEKLAMDMSPQSQAPSRNFSGFFKDKGGERTWGLHPVNCAAYLAYKVSRDYLDLLKERDPTALVLLAHYCLLLKPYSRTSI